MGLFSKIKNFLRGPIYRINREVLADYMNNEIQFSVENFICHHQKVKPKGISS